VGVRVALDVSAVPQQPAGAGRYVVEVARRLRATGLEATLVARRGDAARWRSLAPGASVVDPIPAPRALRLAYEATWLGRSPPFRRADVWHAPHYTMPRAGSTPVVVTIHDLTFFSHPEWHEPAKVAFFTRAIRHAARHAAVLVCVSERTAREFDELVSAKVPVVVAPLGVDLERFTPDATGDDARLDAAGLASAPYVLFLGTAEPRKGLDLLLKAVEDLSTRHRDLELWVAGQAGWGTEVLEGRLATNPRVRRLGFVDDDLVPALLRSARAVVYPSRGEGFGLPVLEALACGSWVVTSRDTVMADVAGDAADLVDVGDVGTLAEAIERAIGADDAARERRATIARVRAERFTWEACVERHVAAYRLAAGR
jgi:glycosyltransferase involved in cell wall biosynthesis